MGREAHDRVAVDVTINLDRHSILATLREIQGLDDPDSITLSRYGTSVVLDPEELGRVVEWLGGRVG